MKRQRRDRLLSLRRFNAPAATIAKILETVRQTPQLLHEPTSATTVSRHTRHQFGEHSHALELVLESGGVFEWPVVLPQHALKYFAERNGYIRELLLREAPKFGAAHHWKTIFYNDELGVGNVLRADNRRKFVAFYWSLLEFGSDLRFEDAWFCCGMLRTGVLQKVRGGLSAVTRAILRAAFVPHPTDQTFTSGITLNLHVPYLFVCQFSVSLGDEASLKETWDLKGSSGMRPCVRCKNCTMKRAALSQHDPLLQTISCINFELFDPQSDNDIWWACDHLMQRQRLDSKANFERLETACGLNWNIRGVLADQELREYVKPTSIHFDGMHCYFSQGIAGLELRNFPEALTRVGINFAEVRQYFEADWRMLGNINTRAIAAMTLSENREKSSEASWKGMASELLSVYPIMDHMARTLLAPFHEIRNELRSFLCMCDIVKQLQRMKRQCPILVSEVVRLKLLQKSHLQAFIACYGEEQVRPKHHYSLHIGDQCLEHGMMLDCFVLERKHKQLKNAANNVHNTSMYETSVMALAWNASLHSASQLADNFVGRRTVSRELAAILGAQEVLVGAHVMHNRLSIYFNDVLVSDTDAIEVCACIQIDGKLCLLVRQFAYCSVASRFKRECDDLALLDLSMSHTFLPATCWFFEADGSLSVLW